jgi:hypothetical protein
MKHTRFFFPYMWANTLWLFDAFRMMILHLGHLQRKDEKIYAYITWESFAGVVRSEKLALPVFPTAQTACDRTSLFFLHFFFSQGCVVEDGLVKAWGDHRWEEFVRRDRHHSAIDCRCTTGMSKDHQFSSLSPFLNKDLAFVWISSLFLSCVAITQPVQCWGFYFQFVRCTRSVNWK